MSTSLGMKAGDLVTRRYLRGEIYRVIAVAPVGINPVVIMSVVSGEKQRIGGMSDGGWIVVSRDAAAESVLARMDELNSQITMLENQRDKWSTALTLVRDDWTPEQAGEI